LEKLVQGSGFKLFEPQEAIESINLSNWAC